MLAFLWSLYKLLSDMELTCKVGPYPPSSRTSCQNLSNWQISLANWWYWSCLRYRLIRSQTCSIEERSLIPSWQGNGLTGNIYISRNDCSVWLSTYPDEMLAYGLRQAVALRCQVWNHNVWTQLCKCRLQACWICGSKSSGL